MTNEELLDDIEARVTYAMLSGCEMDDRLGCKKYDTGSWAVTLRAEEVCALLDLAREAKIKEKRT